MIIIAEYIEYGDHEGYRPAFTSAVAFMSETGVPDLFVAREEYLARRRNEFRLLLENLDISNVRLNPAIDRWKQH